MPFFFAFVVVLLSGVWAPCSSNSMHQNDSLSCRNGSFGQAGSCWGLGSIARLGEWGQAMPIAFGFTKMEAPFRSSFQKASSFVPCSKWAVMAFMGAHLQAGEQVLAL